SEQDEGSVVLEFNVRDTGVGIPNERLAYIFDAFSQADGSMTRKFGGTGLGLAISKQLCEMMGGRISVVSEVGRGSTFSFTAKLKKQPSARRPQEEAVRDLKNIRVLIVDDNAVSRKILHQQVVSWGMANGCAEDGAQALEKMRRAYERGEAYDVVILDRTMPGMSGLELARAIRSDPDLSGARIILMTSVGEIEEMERTREAGVLACVTKPVRQSQLLDAIVSVLSVPSARATEPREVEIPSTPGPAGLSGHVLLAEDNPVNQEVARGMLESLGCTVVVVNDGREALEAVSRGSYDAVLMDCQMPEMDGYEATRLLRQSGRPEIPVIALTAHAMEGDREKCLAAGMNDYLSKPFTREELGRILEQWLPKRFPGRSPASGPSSGSSPAGEDMDSRPEPPTSTTSQDREGDAPDGDFIDWEVWNALRELEQKDDPDFLTMLIGLYVENTPSLVRDLREAAASDDWNGLRRAAHSLKSSSANLGAKIPAALCRQLEALGQAGSTRDTSSIIARLEKEIARFVDAAQRSL
ncbi:MAG TPA: response regulator, partial [Syntrophobacteraceae bacterium]|nr:response regulator [Syntrophobacteraceae bacterium]